MDMEAKTEIKKIKFNLLKLCDRYGNFEADHGSCHDCWHENKSLADSCVEETYKEESLSVN